MTEIPEEFLASNDKLPDDLMDAVVIDGKVVGSVLRPSFSLKKELLETSKIVEDDWLPDGCGIGIGSSYREDD